MKDSNENNMKSFKYGVLTVEHVEKKILVKEKRRSNLENLLLYYYP